MQITATSWLLYELTGSPLQLGLNGLFRAIPAIGLGLFSGTLSDRYDRRRLLLSTQVALALQAFLLGYLDQTELVTVWHIYALTLFSAIVGTLDGPARQAYFPALVPSSILPNAIALNALLWKGTVLIGPSLAGIAIATVGTQGAFYANGASFLAVISALILIRTPSTRRERPGKFVEDLKEGVLYVFARKTILAVMIMEATSSLFGLDQAMLTIFARDILEVGASGLGFLQSARGLGAILGSALLISLGQVHSQGKTLLLSAVLYGASFAFFGLSLFFPLSLLLLLIVGATDTIWGATRNTILQVDTPDAMRGRVMGIFNLSNRGLTPLGQVETGLVVPLLGASGTTFLGGLIVAAVALVTTWSVQGLYSFRWRGEIVVKSPDALKPEGS